MTLIFCADQLEPNKPDRAFAAEVEAATNAGLDRQIVNFERLTRDRNAELAVRRVDAATAPQLAVYRGWMLRPEDYAALYHALQKRNFLLINSPDSYNHCHLLPESYDRIKAHTPRTIWLPLTDCLDEANVKAALQTFADKPVIVKDYVKSRKHEWHEACFIADASDAVAALRVVARFLELQGDDLVGGLVLREFVALKPIGAHAQSAMPLAREFRLFFLNHRLLTSTNYWTQGDYTGESPPLAFFQNLAFAVRSRFFSMDVAQKADGEWIVVELGDGQVAGLPDENLAPEFYRKLAQMPKFELYAQGELMGWSALETSDPPMGCAVGVFYPNENYARIRDIVRAFFSDDGGRTRENWDEIVALKLAVRPENGVAFEPVGGVSVEDFAEELEDESARELNVFGLPYEVFRLHFREAFEAYFGDAN